MKRISAELLAKPGRKVRLSDFDPGDTHGIDKRDAEKRLDKLRAELFDLQTVLYAEARRAVLIVLQGIDASGKDGTIRHVMSGLNPQGVTVTSFKAPEGAERRHDYLWRVHAAVPEWGKLGIFNRSHYEDVLVVRVHELVPESVWSKRFDQINDFERMLSENGVRILKFFLWISKEEQAERLAARLEDPSKNWKFSAEDTKERRYWDQYVEAYEAVLQKCSTDVAPWYVVPSNHKWFRNLAVAEILRDEMRAMKLKYPKAAGGGESTPPAAQ
jgi:PPK2 family polyphosphate:nucleotide phosphotransferase